MMTGRRQAHGLSGISLDYEDKRWSYFFFSPVPGASQAKQSEFIRIFPFAPMN
jgi:hypothetical protein